jgi:alpha-amylase
MGRKVTLLLAIHNHQPVGNFPHVLKEAYQKSYLPFLQALRDHGHMRVTLHYSGFLLEWLAATHPECIALIRELTARGQVEIMSGGFYEPILTTLFDSDKFGQIQKLSAYIRTTFNTEPHGVWLAERVWEPHLTEALAKAGARYTVIDDHHFIMAGLRGKALYGYYLTEEKGRMIKVFPGSERLRYLIPFHPVEETLHFLESVRDSREDALAIMGDDGEKFGIWPGTYKSVYEEGWLSRFFDAIKQNEDWIEVRLLSEIIATRPPLGRIYLPTSSYMEMAEWSLLPDASEDYAQVRNKIREIGLEEKARPFLSGGFWRNFFSKYPESNLMHKKMLFISDKIHHLQPGEHKERALNELWQGQCNDAYWHGVFGGLYLPHLRSSIYEHLILAEAIADVNRHQGQQSWIELFPADIDVDGLDEVIMNTESYVLTIDPHKGGTLMGLDFRPRCFNAQDTLTRIPESYHRDIQDAPESSDDADGAQTIHGRVVAKEAGLAEQIVYDPYPRRSLVDHFLDPGETPESFQAARHRERGTFVQTPYRYRLSGSNAEASLFMERTGNVYLDAKGGEPQPLRIEKTVSGAAGDPTFTAAYRLINPGTRELTGRFGVEFNLTLLAGRAPDRYYTVNGRKPLDAFLCSVGQDEAVRSVQLTDEWQGFGIKISLREPAGLWRFPIETVSQSEGGFEKIYQGSCLLLLWDVRLQPGAAQELAVDVALQTLPERASSGEPSQTMQTVVEKN